MRGYISNSFLMLRLENGLNSSKIESSREEIE